jgi:hypothetical protein
MENGAWGFPLEDVFCVCSSDSPAGCRACRDTETAFHAPARLFVFGWDSQKQLYHAPPEPVIGLVHPCGFEFILLSSRVHAWLSSLSRHAPAPQPAGLVREPPSEPLAASFQNSVSFMLHLPQEPYNDYSE